MVDMNKISEILSQKLISWMKYLQEYTMNNLGTH